MGVCVLDGVFHNNLQSPANAQSENNQESLCWNEDVIIITDD